MTRAKQKLAVFISFSGEGGVERMVSALINEFNEKGHDVDLLLIKARGGHLQAVSDSVNKIKLGSNHSWLTLWPLVKYLRKEKPAALLAVKHRAIMVALIARRLAGVNTRIVGRLGTNVSTALEGKSGFRKLLWHKSMQSIYPMADKLVPVSEGVSDDIRNISGIDKNKLEVIRNPVVTNKTLKLADEPLEHPWFAANQSPVILGAGRFTRQKDFPTLIKAFALLHQQKECRLVILGKGGDQQACRELAESLGVEKDIDFPGFDSNPFRYMRHAALFVLSSAWEGSPNVLCEALAVGTPVVSTNCPSGPFEILQNGKYGILVPVGDAEALAKAMAQTLAQPLDTDSLRQAVAEYTVERSAKRYLQALNIEQAEL